MNDSVFKRHGQPKHESRRHWYRMFGNAAVTRLDNTAAVRSGNAAHSEGCTGKTHTSYMTTWRSVGVRRGNVAYVAYCIPHCLRRQVADLRAQIGMTASPSPARTSGRGRGSAPPRDRLACRGRNFFRGNAGHSRGCAGSARGCAGSARRAPHSSSEPSHQPRGSRGRRRH